MTGWFNDDTPARFAAYGWNVVPNIDGHDAQAVHAAITSALSSDKPTLICCKTVIGFGAPTKAGSEGSHGAPLGKDEIAGARAALGWNYGPFEIPPEIYAAFDGKPRGTAQQADWQARFATYRSAHPELAAEFERVLRAELPANWSKDMAALIGKFDSDGQTIASRKASQMVLASIVPALPELVGGSADLAHSNYSIVPGSKNVIGPEGGNYVYYGVREFGMTAIANGLALHGGIIPFTATFLVFSDYARNAVRLSALIPTRAIHVYTHDSIGLGEDGPTHQPIEHLASLRMIPNLDVWRPCDGVESAVCWKLAVERKDGPSALVFSRQNLQHQFRTAQQIADIERGGYVLLDPADRAVQLILIATGSELELAMQAARQLQLEGIGARVVSMPCTRRFDQQALEYREGVLPGWCRKRIAVEAGVSDFWRKYVGLDGAVIGIDRFGMSAPDKALFAYFGFTVEHVLEAARAL